MWHMWLWVKDTHVAHAAPVLEAHWIGAKLSEEGSLQGLSILEPTRGPKSHLWATGRKCGAMLSRVAVCSAKHQGKSEQLSRRLVFCTEQLSMAWSHQAAGYGMQIRKAAGDLSWLPAAHSPLLALLSARWVGFAWGISILRPVDRAQCAAASTWERFLYCKRYKITLQL